MMNSADPLLSRELSLASLAYAAGWKRLGRLYFVACWGMRGRVGFSIPPSATGDCGRHVECSKEARPPRMHDETTIG